MAYNFDLVIQKLGPQGVLAQFQAIGGQVASTTPGASGFIDVYSIYKPDKNPSARLNLTTGIYVDFSMPGTSEKPFAKALCHWLGERGPYMDWKHAYQELCRQLGIQNGDGENGHKGKKSESPPTLDDISRFQKNLTPEIISYLHDKRGLTDESIAKYKIGWCPKRERNSFPVYIQGSNGGPLLVNIRFHNSKKKPKSLNWSGYGQARLWGLERLAASPAGSIICLTEGEFDSMLAEQVTGYISVSPTNGKGAFQPEWVKYFHGHHVVLLWDCDLEGREAVNRIILPLFKESATSGKILSIKIIWLYEKADKQAKDLTDWIVKDGGSGDQLRKMIESAPLHSYPTLISHLPEPITLISFAEIDYTENAGKRITVPLMVYGENSEAYHAVTKVKVSSCSLIKDGKCTGPLGQDGACLEIINIPLGHRVQLASVAASDDQLRGALRNFICDKDRKPALTIEDQDRLTIREVFAHQVVGPMSVDKTELVEKPIYIIGGNLIEIGKYQATGTVLSSPRGQRPTLLVDTVERLEDDYQTFDIDKARPHLEKLKAMAPADIINDISAHVTKIYERDDLHLGCLLTLCSPLWFNFPGDGRIRGWLSTIIIGDTGTGKTTVSQSIFEYAKVGTRVSGMTSSRTGITYACDYDERRGWRVKAGSFLKMNRQAMILDEAQDLKSDDLKTMAEGIDSGLTKIDRIQAKVFESATRVVFNCNPRDPRKYWEQKTMDSFRYPCQSIQGIFPQMMIRRIDLCLFATAWDIEDKDKIFFPGTLANDPKITSDDFQSLIYYAWNLSEDQIIIDFEVAKKIREDARVLSAIFGGCDDLPIVYAEDFRKTFARLCVAYAVLDLSTNNDFEQITVTTNHVTAVFDFLIDIYHADNCRLDRYAENYFQAHGLGDYKKIIEDINNIINHHEQKMRFLYICQELLKDDSLRQRDLVDHFGVSRITVHNDMRFFTKHHLCTSNTRLGYKGTPKLIKLVNRIEKTNSELLPFHLLNEYIFNNNE